MKRAILPSAFVAVLFAGCAALPINIPVRIYDTESGAVYNGSFSYSGFQGAVSASMVSGGRCAGEYFTRDSRTSSASVGWGSIYGWGANNFSASASAYGVQSVQPGSYAGTAILTCDDRNVIQCEYVVNRDNHGSGYCRDNRTGKYRIMF